MSALPTMAKEESSIHLRPDHGNKMESSIAVAGKNENDTGAYSQTRTRKLFSFSQLFAFSLTYMSLWEGMCT